jgi:hypothetical protein
MEVYASLPGLIEGAQLWELLGSSYRLPFAFVHSLHCRTYRLAYLPEHVSHGGARFNPSNLVEFLALAYAVSFFVPCQCLICTYIYHTAWD